MAALYIRLHDREAGRKEKASNGLGMKASTRHVLSTLLGVGKSNNQTHAQHTHRANTQHLRK